jgi:hypothetical protein
MQRGEPMVASLRTPAAFVHDVVEKGKHARCVNVLEAQPLHGDIAAFLAVAEQQDEGVTIATNGVRARVPLHRKVVCEESAQVNG